MHQTASLLTGGRGTATLLRFHSNRRHSTRGDAWKQARRTEMLNLVQRSTRPMMVPLVSLIVPSAAFAQAAITGVVKDASGGVLPGATVEAASPVLIEKVRSVVTDASGQYRIIDLRPGT